MKKVNSSYLIIGIALISIFAYKFYRSKPIELPKYGNYLSCVGHPFDLKVKLKSELYLVEGALPKSEPDQNMLFWGAIYYQNLYAFTNVLDINPQGPLKWSTISSVDPKIKILSTEKAPYPYDVVIDEEKLDMSGFRPVAADYLNRLFAIKKISKGDPARKIVYEYEANLFTCFNENSTDTFKDLKFPQPLDPYTAYFSFPKTHRVLIKNAGRSGEGVYNPCLNPHSITAHGFNPFGFWYFWRPEAKGHGSDNIPFDCTLFYQPGKNIQYPQVSYEENVPVETKHLNFAHFEKMDRPIKMAILVGGIESKIYQKLNKEDVEKYVSLFLSGMDASEARKQVPEKYDAHFSKVLILLWKVKNHIMIVDTKITSDELSLNLVVRGKLKLSKKDIELRISLSPNHPEFDGADIFAKNFHDEFLTNDIIAYEGHAISGGVFDKGLKLLKDSNYSHQDKSIQYQIFAIYSCASSYYYHPGSFPKIGNEAFRRDVVRTAGSYVDSSSNGSLALIASLDQFLYNESYVPFAFWAKKFKTDNFYILSNQP